MEKKKRYNINKLKPLSSSSWLTFSKSFILVRVVVDLEPILGMPSSMVLKPENLKETHIDAGRATDRNPISETTASLFNGSSGFDGSLH